ncbi:MAG: formylglycine-generating enzyme family protein [Bdellovibrionales bacterium]
MNRVWILFLCFAFQANAIEPAKTPDLTGCERWLKGSATQSSAEWTPRLEILQGRVELLMSVLERHANFVTANLSFRRNVLDTLAHIPAATAALGAHANDLTITPPQVISTSFFSKTVSYDQNATEVFRRKRIEDLQSLKLIPAGPLRAQIIALRNDKKSLKALFRVLPFLFDSNGSARFTKWDKTERRTIARTIEGSAQADWENGYFDFLNEHINSIVETIAKDQGMGQVLQFYRNFKSEFVEKEVRRNFTPVGGNKEELTLRTISMESLPASVAVARGCYGGDCSILSVPFYPLLKGVSVHFIRKSKDLRLKPDGYIVSVAVEVATPSGSKTIPYILTVNGAALSQADIQAAVDLVIASESKFAGSKLVAFPDFAKNSALVNWEQAKRALTHKKGRPTTVKLPAGWKQMDEYHNLNNLTNYTNYYRGEAIETAIVGEFSPIIHRVGKIENTTLQQPGYSRPRRVADVNRLERAIVGLQALQDSESNQARRSELFGVLQVNASEVSAVEPLLNLSPDQGLNISQYRALEKESGFGLKNILAFEAETRAKVLTDLYEEGPGLFTEHRARDNAKVRDTLLKHYGHEDYQSLIGSVWDAREISDDDLLKFLKLSMVTLGSNRVEDFLSFLKSLTDGKAASWQSFWFQKVVEAYLKSVNSDPSLARGLAKLFRSGNSSEMNFGKAVLDQGLKSMEYRERFPILQVYAGVLGYLQRTASLEKAFDAWIVDARVAPEIKADFVMTLVGLGENAFDRYFRKIQGSEQEAFWRRVDQRSDLRLFLRLAEQKRMRALLLDNANIESFLFVSTGMPTVKSPVTFEMGERGNTHTVTLTRPIEVAVAPDTHLKWILVTGENPSRFKEESQPVVSGLRSALGLKRNEKQEFLNRPVEQVTWWSAIWYANEKSKLAGLEPAYDLTNVALTDSGANGQLQGKGEVRVKWDANGYRLPTESEQERYVRAGTTTTYPFGNNVKQLPLYGWFDENAGGKTHPVAELRPNHFGIHDSIGNVWEWGWDWHDSYPNESVTDPSGPSEGGSDRVIRGGSWFYNARGLRSADRSYVGPGGRDDGLGLRLVRTAK